MAHPSKRKGDKAELEAVQYLVASVPDLVVADPMRMLGAGRRDDVGDLRVFPDTAVQVRFYALAKLAVGLRSAACDAASQAANARYPHHLGMVKYPGARTPSVRWLATTTAWPDPGVQARDFGSAVGSAVAWVRDDVGPKPNPRARRAPVEHPGRADRVAYIHGRGAEPYFLAPMEAWLDVYRGTRTPGLAAA